MKKHLLKVLFLIFLLSGVTYVKAQQCESKGITTDPRNGFSNSVNTEKPSKRNTFFDWTTEYYNVNSSVITGPQILSPFYQGFQNDNVWALFENKEMSPDDGWELIHYDFGFNEDGTPKSPKADYVDVILYNRYTGVMRVFLAGDGPPFNGASMKMSFALGGTLYTSVISNASDLFALDKFESNPQIVGITRYLNTSAKWFYADFQMTYDPCTCFYESTLEINVELINEAAINITGSFEGTIATIENNNGTVNESGFTAESVIEAGKKAQKSYKSMAEFTKDQMKALKIEGKTDAELNEAQLNKKHQLNAFQQLLKDNKDLKAGLKLLPYVPAAIELVSFFIGGGKKSSGPQEVKIMPMAINATINLKGSLSASYPYKDIFFYTPGSKNVSTKNPVLYPYYNEVLGTVNLLTTPKLYYNNYGYRYQLDYSSLELVINPASNYKPDQYEIYGNLIFHGVVGGVSTPSGPVSTATGFLPITALGDFASNLPIQIDLGDDLLANYTWTSAEIKLLIRLIRKDDAPDIQNSLIVFSYPVQLVENLSFQYSTNNARLVHNYYTDEMSENYLITNTVQNKVYNSWNGSIVVKSGGVLKPNTTLKIGSNQFRDHSSFIPVASATRVSQFCASTPYKNNRNPSARESTKILENKALDYGVNAFPNPSQGDIVFKILLARSQKISLTISDLTGRKESMVYEGEYSGENGMEISYQGGHLPSGLYIYTLNTENRTIAKKLVVR
jgi:hypothetical protein